MSNGSSMTRGSGEVFDVLIIGSGPAGLTSAIKKKRAALSTVVIGGTSWGGQLMLTTEVENFPGFPEGIMGPKLMDKIRKQAERFGAIIVLEDVEKVAFKNVGEFSAWAGNKEYKARSVIIATGAQTTWLGLPNEQKLIGRGVSSCAPCDAPFFRDKNIIVIGGGDSAMEEALVLSRFAAEVAIVHRRDEFRASKIMQEKVSKDPKIKLLLNREIVDVIGEVRVVGVKIRDNKTKEVVEFPIDGIFVAIGHTPATNIFKGEIDLDEKGYIKVFDRTKTSVEGVFAAGDVHDYHYKQAVTAAAFGCMAALDVEKWLMEHK